jgi:hypothetical protein
VGAMSLDRLTQADWKMINEALTSHENELWQEVYGWDDEYTERYYAQITATRKKVWARLPKDQT